MAKIFKTPDDVPVDDTSSRKSSARLELTSDELHRLARGEHIDVQLDVSAALSRPEWTIRVVAPR